MHLFRNTIPVAVVVFIISELEKLIKKKSKVTTFLKLETHIFPIYTLCSMKTQVNSVYEFLKNCLKFSKIIFQFI